MVVLLPKKMDGLAEFEKSLTEQADAGWGNEHGEGSACHVAKIQGDPRIRPEKHVSDLGMPTAFHREQRTSPA